MAAPTPSQTAAAASAGATVPACVPSTSVEDASFAFDADGWPSEGRGAATADDAATLRRSFAHGLRAHDGRLGASARRILRRVCDGADPDEVDSGDGGWRAAALLSWAHHSGRTALLPPMLALLPARVRASLLHHLLRYTPYLPLLHSLLVCCPQLSGQIDLPLQCLSLLRSLCAGAKPNVTSLRWLLDSLQHLPEELREGSDDARGSDGDGLHLLNSLVRRQQLRTRPRPIAMFGPGSSTHVDVTQCSRHRCGCVPLWCAIGFIDVIMIMFDQLDKQRHRAIPAPDLFKMVHALLQWDPGMVRRADERDNRLPLHYALSFRSAELPFKVVEMLIEMHPEALQHPDANGAMPVHVYITDAARPSVVVLQLLSSSSSSCGGDVDGAATLRAHTKNGQTLLHLYCRRDVIDLDVLTFLCDSYPASLTHADEFGRVPLMMLCTGHSASVPAAELLISRAPSCATHIAKDGSTALMSLRPFSAAKAPLFELLQDLHPVMVPLRRGETNVLHMILRDQEDPIPLALFRKVLQLHPELALQEDSQHQLPLHLAVQLPLLRWGQHGQDGLELLKLLLLPEHQPALQLRAVDGSSSTALHMLAMNESRPPGSLTLLAGQCSAALSMEAWDRGTPMHNMLRKPNLPSVEELDAIVRLAPDCMGLLEYGHKTPLHFLAAAGADAAAGGPDPALLRLAIQAHPQAVTMATSAGLTPLMVLCQNSVDVQCVQLLLDAAAALSFASATVADQSGNTALHRACSNRRVTTPLLQLLLRSAPQTAALANQSKSLPLHLLCANAAVTAEMLRVLIDAHSPAVLSVDGDQRLPLHLLLRNTRASSAARVSAAGMAAAEPAPEPRPSLLEMVQLLLHSSTGEPTQQQLTARDGEGWAPLHLYFLRPGPRDIRVLQALLPSATATPAASISLHNSTDPDLSVLGAMCAKVADGVEPPQPAELQLLLDGPLRGAGLSEIDVAALCGAPYINAELLRLVLSTIPAAAVADRTAFADQYLPRFESLISNPRLDLPMLQLLLDAFPADPTSSSAAAGARDWGSQPWLDGGCSAISALLANEAAMDSPHFVEMAMLLLVRAPSELTNFHDGRGWDIAIGAPRRKRIRYTVLAALLRAVEPKPIGPGSDRNDSTAAAAPVLTLQLAQALLSLDPTLLSRPNPQGQLPLHQLAAHPDAALVDELAAWMVEHTPRECLRTKDPLSGATPAFALFRAQESPKLLLSLLQKEPAVALDKFEKGCLLHHLCGSRVHDVELLRACIAAHPGAMQKQDFGGRLPPHQLCKMHMTRDGDSEPRKFVSMEEIAWLATAVPEALSARSSRGRTPLMDACAHESLTPPLLQEMLKHCDSPTMLAVDRDGCTALHEICSSHYALSLDALQLLLGPYPELAAAGRPALLPLHALAANPFATSEMVMLVLRAHPSALHVPNRGQLTPLQEVWARRHSNRHTGDIIAALVDYDPHALQSHASFWRELCADESLGLGAAPQRPLKWDTLRLLGAVLTTLQQPAHRALQSAAPSPPGLALSTVDAAWMWTQLLRLPARRAPVELIFAQLLDLCPELPLFVFPAVSVAASGPSSGSASGATGSVVLAPAGHGVGSRGGLLHASARAGCLPACRLLVQAGAPLLLEDSAGLTALAHCPQGVHPAAHAYLATQIRLRSMFRGRFEIDTERGVRLSGHGKVKFAFDCGEGALLKLQRQSEQDELGEGGDSNRAADSGAGPPSASASVSTSNDSTAAVAATSAIIPKPTRIPAVIKFFNDRDDFVRERDLHARLSTAARGLYLPRLLASYDPVPGAAEGSDDSLPALCMEAGSESVRQQIERRAAGGSGVSGSGRPGGSVCWSAMDVLGVAAGCVSALRFLHNGQGVVHADLKAENVAAFADDYRLIDFGSACDSGAPMSLEYSAHFTPPEQAKRVLTVRQARQQAEDAVAAGGVGADGRPLLTPLAAASPPVSTPPLYADSSYDIWSLGVLLFTLRAGRPLFDSSTGDRETDTDMILDAIATATDESILLLLKQQQRSRLVKLQDNEVSLLRHMLAVAPEERFTIDEVAAALDGMLHGLSATQKVQSLDRMVSAVRDVGVGMAAVGSQIKLGHKQMAKIDEGLQGVEQQVKQVKVGVKAVAAGQGAAASSSASSSSAATSSAAIAVSSSVAPDACLRSRAECEASVQEVAELRGQHERQRSQIEQLQAEIDRLTARLAASSPEARTAKVAPETPASVRTAGNHDATTTVDKKPAGGCIVC